MKWSFASSAFNSGLPPKSPDESEVAAIDQSAGGDAESHPDPAAKPE